MKNNFYEYYKSKLTIKESCDYNSILLGISTNGVNKMNTQVELEENSEKELAEVFEPVKKFFFQIRNNIQHVLNIIKNIKANDEIDQLVNLLCHFFFENILTQKPEQEEILLICYLLLEKEIENLNTPSVSSFLNGSFIGKLLKSFTRRQDIKSYLSMILGDLILKIEKSTINCLEIDVSRINDHLKDKKTGEILNKSFSLEKVKKMFNIDKKLFLGDRIRKTTIAKKPNSKHHSKKMSQINLGFSENFLPKLKALRKTKLLDNFDSKSLPSKSVCFDFSNIENNSKPTYRGSQSQKEILLLQKILAGKRSSINDHKTEILQENPKNNMKKTSDIDDDNNLNESITTIEEESDDE